MNEQTPKNVIPGHNGWAPQRPVNHAKSCLGPPLRTALRRYNGMLAPWAMASFSTAIIPGLLTAHGTIDTKPYPSSHEIASGYLVWEAETTSMELASFRAECSTSHVPVRGWTSHKSSYDLEAYLHWNIFFWFLFGPMPAAQCHCFLFFYFPPITLIFPQLLYFIEWLLLPRCFPILIFSPLNKYPSPEYPKK